MNTTVTREGAYIIYRVDGTIRSTARADRIDGVRDDSRTYDGRNYPHVQLLVGSGIVPMGCTPQHVHTLITAKESE